MEKNTFFSEGAVVSVLTAEPIDKLLDYSVLQGGVYLGDFVEIELGSRTVLGLVWGSQVSFLEPRRLKVIKKRLKNFKINKNTRIFIKRMADYYLTSENKIFRLTSWKNFLKGGGKISYGYELEKIELRDVISLVTSKGRRVIEFLSTNNEVKKPKTINQITEAASVSPSVIESLRRRGFIKKVIINEEGVVSRTRLSYRASLNTEQKMASEEIKQNMSGSCFSVTLLRGITGSGKTEVFLDQAARQIAKGFQVLILVPEIGLSSALVSRIEKKLGIKALEWNSEVSNSTKIKVFEYLMSDNEYAQIIVGARSALFLPIKRLGLIIIDEQHKFGVNQRKELSDKGGNDCDVLVMSATPIPRTMMMTIYGDMDVTLIREKPKNRKEIKTYSKLDSKIGEVIKFAKKEIVNGGQVFWVCPLIEKSKKLDHQSAVEKNKYLQRYFDNRVGLIHGSMEKNDKNKILNDFLNKKIDVLVSTTVIEVGIDFPNANVIIIENANKYGLSQLHQLRGRVGRGNKKSYCILLFKSQLSENAKKRINILKSSNDGFEISEEDMKLRGYGDILGFKQSGVKKFKIADPILHRDLFELAEEEIKKIEQNNSKLGDYYKLLKLYDRASIINDII